MKTGEIYKEAEQTLRPFTGQREVSSIEAYCLVSHVLNKDKSYLLTYPDEEVPADKVEQIRELVKVRLSGKPIAYILGWREFWSLKLKVTEDTLIPRPDSESVVDQAILKINELVTKKSIKDIRILDLGTGTGALALALKKEYPEADVNAIDYSEGALKVASENSKNLNLPVKIWNSDWFKSIDDNDMYDVIVSNPPYIEQDDPHLQEGDVRFEPRTSLVAPMNGLKDLLDVIHGSVKHLNDGGWLIVEHGYQQGPDVRHLFMDAGYTAVETVRDLGNNERVTLGCLKKED